MAHVSNSVMRGVGASQRPAERHRLTLAIDPRPTPKTIELEHTTSRPVNCMILLASGAATTSIYIID